MNISDLLKGEGLKFLKWVEIITDENQAVKTSAMYILQKDLDFCDIIIVSDKGKKRRVGGASNDSNFVHVIGNENVDGIKTFQKAIQANEGLVSSGHVVNEGINWTTRTGGNQVISVQATLDATTSTTDVAGGFMRFQTTGSNCNIDGLMIELSAGYTGNKTVRGINVHNRVAGADTLDILGESGTIGLSTQSQGQSTGDNIGVYSIAGFAQGKNIAGYFRAMQDPTGDVSDLNIGVLAYAGHHLPNTSNQVGGYFALGHDYQFAIQPNLLTSCALVADNGDFEHPIFKAKRYGSDVFEIKSKGEIVSTPSHNNVTPLTVTALAGQSANLIYMSIGGVEKWKVSKHGDTIMGGRLLFQESGGGTYAQAVYCENGSNNVVIRTGPTANRLIFKRSDATSIGGFSGATNTFYWGQAIVSSSISLHPQNGMILQGDLDMSFETVIPAGIILRDTVLGTRHKITLTNGELVVSAAL